MDDNSVRAGDWFHSPTGEIGPSTPDVSSRNAVQLTPNPKKSNAKR